MASCAWCGSTFEDKTAGGPPRLWCSNACKQAGYRQRKEGVAVEPSYPVELYKDEADYQRFLTASRGFPPPASEAVEAHIWESQRENPGPQWETPGDKEFQRFAGLAAQSEEVSRWMGKSMSAKAVAHWVKTGQILDTPAGQKSLVADVTGAILLPTDFQLDIATVARETGTIRQLAGVRPTNFIKQRAGLLSAASVGWGRLEGGTSITDAAMAVSSPALDIDVHDVLALALVGLDELDDEPSGVQAAITEAIGIAIAEAEDAAFANGTGTGQPRGLAAAANVARVPSGQKVAAGASATPTAADLASIPPKLPVKYRRNAVWLASTDMYAKIIALLYPTATLATSAGPQVGPLNYPMYEIPGLPSAATAGTTDPSVWFVNLAMCYRIVDRGPGVTITRLTQRYAELGYVGLLVKARRGGDMVRGDAACLYTL